MFLTIIRIRPARLALVLLAAGFSAQGLAGQDDFDVTMFNTRAEVDVQARFSRKLSGYMKARAYFWGEDLFTDGRVGDHFSQKGMFHGDAGNILEVLVISGRDAEEVTGTVTAAQYSLRSRRRASNKNDHESTETGTPSHRHKSSISIYLTYCS